MLLAIDPGVDTGWAEFALTGELRKCGLGHPRSGEWLERIVVESPKLRPYGEKNPNAILTLARTAGYLAGRAVEAACASVQVEYLTPNDWKGSTPKDISHARIWARLTDAEKEIADSYFRSAPGRNGLAPSKRHNVLDAIGIGLFAVGRKA